MSTLTVTTKAARTSTTAGRTPRRSANIALWTLQVLTAAVFVVAALPKVTADPQAVAGFTELGFGTTGMYIIGALELAGAVALLIPRLCGLAGVAFVGLMVGAVIATAAAFGASAMVAAPAVVLVLVSVIAWGRWGRTAELVAGVRSYRR